MILLKIFYFLKGYVIINIIDKEGAKLINIASENNIYLWNVTATRAYVRKSDLARLKALAKRNAIVIESGKEISFQNSYLHHLGWFALLGALLITLFFMMASGYVWEIEINGCEGEIAGEVLSVLEEKGLRIGVRKSTLPNGNTLRDSVIYNVNGVNWAWVYLDGTLARVEVSVGVPPPEMDTDTAPCNISAARDGIITFISAKNGRTLLNEGDKVSEGDIIISGAMPGGTLYPPYTVRAKGEVYAQTVHTDSVIVPLNKTYTKDTGEEFTLHTIRLFELEIPLGRISSMPFEEYRTELHTPPVGICTYRYIETQSYTEQIPEELAVEEAREIMYERIAKTLSPGSKKNDERVVVERITKDSIKVTLSMSFTENIGVQTPVNLWQTEELTNDKTD